MKKNLKENGVLFYINDKNSEICVAFKTSIFIHNLL